MRAMLILMLVVIVCASPVLARTDTLTGAWPVPLTDILTDYLPADQITGGPVVRTRIDSREAWQSKRGSIVRRVEELLGRAPEFSGALDISYSGEVKRDGRRRGGDLRSVPRLWKARPSEVPSGHGRGEVHRLLQ